MSQENENFGGGSGGGCDKNHEVHHYDGTYTLEANQFEFKARSAAPPASPDPCFVTIISQNTLNPNQGQVNIHGQSGVRVTTTGPIPLPPTNSTQTNGVEVLVGESHKITLERGLLQASSYPAQLDQLIEMTPDGITVHGGIQPVTVKSNTEIKLTVGMIGDICSMTITPDSIELSAGFGVSKITMNMEGITLSACAGMQSIALNKQGITIEGLPYVNIN